MGENFVKKMAYTGDRNGGAELGVHIVFMTMVHILLVHLVGNLLISLV